MRVLAVVSLALVVAACADSETQVARELAHGDEFRRAGHFADAAIMYRRALQIDEDNAAAFERLVGAYRAAGLNLEAFSTCRAWSEANPHSRAARLALIDLLLALGRPDAAASAADKALGRFSADADILIASARARLALGQVDAATRRSEEALRTGRSGIAARVLLADVLAARGQSAEAEPVYREAVEAAGQDPVAAIAYGEFLYSMARVDEAEKQFRRAAAIAPYHERANRALAGLLLNAGRAPEAEPFFRQAADAPSSQLGSTIALADYLWEEGRAAEARAWLQVLVKRGDHAAVARVRLAALAHEAGNHEQAHRELDAALQNNAPAEAWLFKATLLSRDGRPRDALNAVQRAMAIAPDHAPAIYLAGVLHSDLGEWSDARRAFERLRDDHRLGTAAALRLADVSLAMGRPAEALRSLRETSGAQGSVGADVLRARAIAEMGDADRARRTLQELAARQRSPAPWFALGTLELKAGRPELAEDAFAKAVFHAPRAAGPRAGRVVALMTAGRTGDALRAVRELLELGRDARTLVLAADVYRSAAQLAEAVRLAQEAQRADPSLWVASAIQAQALLEIGDARQAESVLAAATARHDSVADLHVALGVLRQQQGRLDDAQREYERALTLDPRQPVAANNLAWMYAEQGQKLDDAVRLASVAVSGMPRSADAHDTLGWVHLKRGQPLLAVMPFENAVAAAPENATYREHLRMAQAAANKMVGSK